ncbi:NADH-quinone oxidoreductase subunit E [Maribius pontilimi]|uniref:NADH-quinone oxidoreductase subunit E n=1 Tax=Palleronia pontilimi TaxID=1964209 RepID=A0A934IAJ1_9RHOB|nr:NADH-quinone oxidoreductase subunit E [Palleronia pontilimi]MBJ3763524.1 NADH-quinone oxidoreductase subunit E [Palleronia pontilimi]
MLRRLHPDQPDSFAFTPANLEWAEAQMTKYPEGRQASAVIPLLWRAQEQEGWLSRPAIEEVGRMLDMAYIRVLEVATFYFMFQLQPVGSVAHIQVCGTTSCMICGAEDLIAVCKNKIAPRAHQLSDDGKFSWEEVECLGACANAPMAQIGKDYYEDLTADNFAALIDRMAAGEVPTPGSQQGRFASEPAPGLTSLGGDADHDSNASVTLATELGDTIKRIDGTEVPLLTPWRDTVQAGATQPPESRDDLLGPKGGIDSPTPGAKPAANTPVTDKSLTKQETDEVNKARPEEGSVIDAPEKADRNIHEAGATATAMGSARERTGAGTGPLDADASADNDAAANVAEGDETRPAALDGPREGQADDLKDIKGVGPKLEALLHEMGFYHFDQIASWTPREIAWVDRNLEGFKGRVLRDDWVGQARILARDGETDPTSRAK